MRQFLNILNEATAQQEKLDRSAFIYMRPKEPEDQFAQCASCQHFKPDSGCSLFSAADKVSAGDSCGLYAHGTPDRTLAYSSATTPAEAGFIRGPVRCTNCSWKDGGACGLYTLLNQSLPDVFELETSIEENACCNAFQTG